ncbi:hypothetical protein M758_4G139500 [Ceratodon purpureus]|uniref:Acyl carrier protein n=1 Tax=Ceratodon purpureus TaxID=3225 RepID=A0A8T0IAH1_CERPU|nr:hypothetical protein KC19_4G138000 [Ceratodon purpureus]KAG0619433.1 hypothetical protein M758_4G139500 [Ceratodon purpureus]
MQAVRPSLRALQASLLHHLRVPVVATGGWGNARTMSDEAHAHGAYLDRRDVIDRVLDVVKSNEKVDASKVSETATFKDMGLDSLDEVEVVMALEEEFALEIPDAEADKIRSAPDAIDYIASHPMAK